MTLGYQIHRLLAIPIPVRIARMMSHSDTDDDENIFVLSFASSIVSVHGEPIFHAENQLAVLEPENQAEIENIIVPAISVPVVYVPAANIRMQMQLTLREMNHRMRGLEIASVATSQTGIQVAPKTFPFPLLDAFVKLESKLDDLHKYDKKYVRRIEAQLLWLTLHTFPM